MRRWRVVRSPEIAAFRFDVLTRANPPSLRVEAFAFFALCTAFIFVSAVMVEFYPFSLSTRFFRRRKPGGRNERTYCT